MRNDPYEKIHVGQEAVVKKTFTAEDVDLFARLSGDENPLHMEEEFAARAAFQQRVVHGMLSASLLSTLIGMKIPGRGAFYLSQTLDFLSPVYPGDTLCARGKVVRKWEESRTLELTTDVEKLTGERVISGTAVVQVMNIKDIKKHDKEKKPVMGEQILQGQVALVTGASRGIGREIALTLARHGADVWVNFRSSRSATELVVSEIEGLGGRAKAVKADVTQQGDVAGMFEEIAADDTMSVIDILVNNAGPPIKSGFLDKWSWHDMASAYEKIVGPVFHCTQAVLPLMQEKGGRVVNVITSAALGRTALAWLPYVSAKAALIGFSKNIAQELGPKGIRVNMVSPSMADTDLTAQVPERYKQEMISQTPLRRLAGPEDVAGAVLYLVSPMANFVTGENLLITGGQIMV